MTQRALILAAVLAALLALIISPMGGLGWGLTPEGQDQGERFALLIVDETKTFSSSIRVQVLASLLNKSGKFALSARFVDVPSSFADPLRGLEPDRRYDLILIIPRGIDDGTVRQLWIASRPFPEISEGLRGAIALLKQLAGRVFIGAAEAVDVTDDLIPGYFATIFIREGWL